MPGKGAMRRVVGLAVAMAGFRVDRPVTLFAGTAALAFALRIESPRAAVLYFAVTWLCYYVGNTVVLAAPGKRERTYAFYEALLAFGFANQTAALGCLAVVPGRISDHVAPLPVAGALLFAAGYLVKLWAAYLVGLGAYYFRDLYLGLPGPLVATGPYRFFKNPMYGVGNLHAYGYALLADSVPVLIGAACLQAGAYVIYFAVERPFVAAAVRGE